MSKQTGCIIGVLVFLAVALSLGIGLGLGLRRYAPRDDSNIDAPPGLMRKDDMDKMKTTPRPMPTETSPTPTAPKRTSPHEKYRVTAVQSDASECSKIGMDIIVRERGNAVDAAVATLFCIGVVNMQSSGIGGGHFMTVYIPKEKKVYTRLSREVLPAAGHRDFFKNVSSSQGGTAVGVPGEVRGMRSAWELYGSVPWTKLVAPSIKLAEGGFEIAGGLADAIKVKEADILADTNLRSVLTKDGKILKEGDILKRPKYGMTLRTISKDANSFYEGSLADDIISDVNERNGVLTKADMAQYTTQDTTPIMGRLKSQNLTMYGPPPPSSGIVFQFILRVLDGFNLTKDSIKDTPSKVATYQKMLETWKFAYAKRSALGDYNFATAQVEEMVRNLTDDAYIDSIRAKVDLDMTYNTSFYEPQFEQAPDSGTTHLNVLAPDGSAVAITSSINTYFGSLVLGTRTGIMFNNQLDDFSVPGQVNSWGFSPSPSNYAVPGKMPMSSMSPSIFLTDDDEVAFMVGAEGGSSIISSTAFVTLHNFYFGLDIGEAVNHPRFHHQLFPNEVRYEKDWDEDVVDGLKAKGHKFNKLDKAYSTVGSIKNRCASCKENCDEHCIDAVSDKRKGGGKPYGY